MLISDKKTYLFELACTVSSQNVTNNILFYVELDIALGAKMAIIANYLFIAVKIYFFSFKIITIYPRYDSRFSKVFG